MSVQRKRPRSAGRSALIATPFLWLGIFFVLPFLIVLKISFSEPTDGRPPYEPVFDPAAGFWALWDAARKLTAGSYVNLFNDRLFFDAFASSLWIAAIATLLALLIAYPMALAMARAPRRMQPYLVLLAIAPFWTSFLIRIYAWIAILKDEGLLNHALISLGLISEPLHIYATQGAVLIGIVYSYLPFMILPIYNALEKQDQALSEAALDLGATPLRAFASITLPLSKGGIAAGCLLVFIPAIGEFVIPDLLGPSDLLMIGRTLWDEFFNARNWPGAAAVAVALLALLVAPIAWYQRMSANKAERGA